MSVYEVMYIELLSDVWSLFTSNQALDGKNVTLNCELYLSIVFFSLLKMDVFINFGLLFTLTRLKKMIDSFNEREKLSETL